MEGLEGRRPSGRKMKAAGLRARDEETTMIPASVERVPRHTAAAINRRISEETDARVRHLAGHPAEIGRRLRELDEEWDVERLLEANAATLALAGVGLAAAVDKRWLALPAIVTAFLLQHAVQGWCPPLPILRRLGFRTPHEIDVERHALKALRGDYDRAGTQAGDLLHSARGALEAARL
jgi:hypothetical protein